MKFLLLLLLILPLILIKYSFVLTIITLTMIYSLSVLGLNIIMGYTGQISIGHAAFMSIGAYTSALIVMKLHLPVIFGILSAILITFGVGYILGFPALRLSGFYLAIATMGFGVAVEQIMGAWESLTGGHIGIRNIPFMKIVNNDAGKYYFVLFFLIIGYLISKNLLYGKVGRAWKSIRENETASLVLGINVSKYKLLAFAYGSALAGLSGALYAHVIGYISPSDFGLSKSLDILAMAVIGGLGILDGPIYGSIIYTTLPFLFSRTNFSLSILFGFLLISTVLFMPKGIGYYILLFRLKHLGKIEKIFRRGRKMYGKILNTSVGKIHYWEKGEGEPVVLVHGNFASARWFKEMMEKVPDGYKAIALDLPNFGYSDRLSKEISIHNYAISLKAFADALDLKKFILLGHSLGGAVVMDFAVNFPEYVKKLVLVDSSPIDGYKTPEENYPVLEMLKNNPTLLEQSLKAIAPTYNDLQFFKDAVSDALRMAEECFTGNARALENAIFVDKVGNINIPVIVIWGDKDTIISREMAEKTAKAFKNSKLIIYENVGHSPILEVPEKVWQAIIE